MVISGSWAPIQWLPSSVVPDGKFEMSSFVSKTQYFGKNIHKIITTTENNFINENKAEDLDLKYEKS